MELTVFMAAPTGQKPSHFLSGLHGDVLRRLRGAGSNPIGATLSHQLGRIAERRFFKGRRQASGVGQ